MAVLTNVRILADLSVKASAFERNWARFAEVCADRAAENRRLAEEVHRSEQLERVGPGRPANETRTVFPYLMKRQRHASVS